MSKQYELSLDNIEIASGVLSAIHERIDHIVKSQSVVESIVGVEKNQSNEAVAMASLLLANTYLLELSKHLVNGLPLFDALTATILGETKL